MKRLTFSIQERVANLLELVAGRAANGNASLVAEAAIAFMLEQPFSQVEALVRRQRLDRLAVTRAGWMRAFWDTLGELMGQPDAIDNERAPRRFGGFYAVLLMHSIAREDREQDPFYPHIGPQPVLPDSPPPHQWTFERESSPVLAARTVAAKLREYGVAAAL